MINYILKIIIPLIIYTHFFSITVAGSLIGGSSQMTTSGDGTICTLNTGRSTTSTTSKNYNCIIATNNNAFIIMNTAESNGYPDSTKLDTAINNAASDSIVLGKNSQTLNPNDVALGNNSKTTAVVATASSTVAGNAYNHAGNNPTSAVAVGESGKERIIQSVAAGQVSATSTDAVNGSQLYAAYDAINSMYQRQMAGYDSEIKQINQNMNDLKEGAYAGIAGALAVGNLPQPSSPGKNMISGGMGTYKGHSAAAFGFSSVSENDKIIWKIGASFDSNRNSGGAVSMGYQW